MYVQMLHTLLMKWLITLKIHYNLQCLLLKSEWIHNMCLSKGNPFMHVRNGWISFMESIDLIEFINGIMVYALKEEQWTKNEMTTHNRKILFQNTESHVMYRNFTKRSIVHICTVARFESFHLNAVYTLVKVCNEWRTRAQAK